MFKEEIAKRLGNQRLCYVKIYGAKSPGQVTAECRIGNVKSEELSGRMAKLVEQWDVKQFASLKQFFFIRQEAYDSLPQRLSEALRDYWPIRSALFELFDEGAFGEDADKVYRDYIGMSSIYSVISQVREKEGKLEDCQLTMLIFQVGGDFEIR